MTTTRQPPRPRRRPGGLTDKQRAFVVEYCVDWNATQAAVRAGYADATAAAEGWRLLRNAKVKAAVDARTEQIADTAEVSGARVLLELARVGFADVRQVFDADGRLRLPAALPDGIAAAVASIEVVTRAVDENEVEYVHKYRLVPKTPALELLGKRLGILTEIVEHRAPDGSAATIRIVHEHHPGPSDTTGVGRNRAKQG